MLLLRVLAAIPVLLLLFGCATGPVVSETSDPFLRTLPVLTEAPLKGMCKRGDIVEVPCVVVLEADWQAMVIYAKSACLALGGTEEACQTKLRASATVRD